MTALAPNETLAVHPLSSDDYDDISAQLQRLAHIDARNVTFNKGVLFNGLTSKAITEAIRLETEDRSAFGKTLSVRTYDDLAPSDRERLAWRYLGALSMAKEKEVRS